MLVSDLLYLVQFQVVRTWVSTLAEDEWSAASALPGWSVRELVAHLVGTGDSIAALTPADEPARAARLTFGEYLALLRPAAVDIEAVAVQIAVRAGGVIPALEDAHRQARDRLADLGGADRIVRSVRGPILLSVFLDTRLLELVVHTDDLARSLPHRRAPHLSPAATRRLVTMLREALTERASDPVGTLAAASALEPVEFLRAATGRPTANRPPDALATSLPLL